LLSQCPEGKKIREGEGLYLSVNRDRDVGKRGGKGEEKYWQPVWTKGRRKNVHITVHER